MPIPEGDLEALLTQRHEIDQALVERQRELTVMFTDIVGSTQYFEKHGDIEGMALLRRHNDLLFPVVKQNGGRIIKTIGDAIMAVFEKPADGVACAVAMQSALAAEKRAHSQAAIHIRIGLHGGRVFATAEDVFGDTVNTAARVAHEAKSDEILVSHQLIASCGRDLTLVTTPRGNLTLKGKADPLPVARVHWREDDRSADTAPGLPTVANSEVFVLEIQRGSSGLKVAVLDGLADKGTVKAYAELPVSPEDLDGVARHFSAFLQGSGADSYREQIRAQGAELFERALSDRAKRHLLETPLRVLRLHLDDHVVHVPWELMHDGTEFLCLKFAIGRMVSARSETSPVSRIGKARFGCAVVVSDPSGDLPAAHSEGDAVAGLLRERFAGEVRHLKGPIERGELLAALADCTVLHFAGHASRAGEGGAAFMLADGRVSPEDIVQAVGPVAPALIFANSCGATVGKGVAEGARSLSDLASAFLLRGTQHFIGPTNQIIDGDALSFALRFYERALDSGSLGGAALAARRALAADAAHPLSFAAYVLYGDPRISLPMGRRPAAPEQPTRSYQGENAAPAHASPTPPAPIPLRSKLPTRPDRPSRAPAPSSAFRLAWILGGLSIALSVAGLIGLKLRTPPEPVAVAPVPPLVPLESPRPPPSKTPTATPPPAPVSHTGPLRISVLAFKNVTGASKLDYLGDAFSEAIETGVGHDSNVRLIEHPQITTQIDYLEFTQSKYVDAATREQIGKIVGAEVVVMGSYQKAGTTMRASARMIDVATGEVLETIKVERPEQEVFQLQDAVAQKVRSELKPLEERLRP